MIPQISSIQHSSLALAPWQQALKHCVRTLSELLELVNLNIEDFQEGLNLQNDFPIRVPHSFVNRIEKNNPFDPLLRQVLPLQSELVFYSGFTSDPLKETDFNPVPGLLYKYNSRALMLLTSLCAIHCRYCFRKEFPYEQNKISDLKLNTILQFLNKHSNISELILSGGDPLSLKDAHLSYYIKSIEAIQHIRILRIHTRFPIVIPERITSELLEILTQTRLKVVMVLHSNHPNELSDEVVEYLKKLHHPNITLLNQSVLLKGVNNTPQILKALSFRLFEANVIPYYLHQLDSVVGTQHFQVSLPESKKILFELAAMTPGYLLPRFVQELPGRYSKIPIHYHDLK
ncbi:MAG: lysine 2,3-aminomutase [Francisellaceae bacterium]|nr:lysine 2,3-aminomutase [Francisellaceae bacterium]